MKYLLEKQKAFTLVEVLIAVVILVVVIGAVTGLERSHIITGSSSKYNIQANGVGQEGVNLVKAISDKVALNDGKTDTIGGDCKDPNNCAAGIYYLNSSSQLIKCSICKDKNGNGGPACPMTNLSSTDLLCGNDEAKIKQDNKEFTRTVIIP